MSIAFFKKYPDADPNRFVLRDGKVLFKLNPDNEYRLLDIESDTYQRTSTWTKFLTSYKERGFGIFFTDGTVPEFQNTRFPNDPTRQGWGKHPIIDSTFQKPVDLGYVTNKFKIYVTNTEYFMTDLFFPPEDWKEGKTINEVAGLDIRKRPFDYKNESYFTMLCATYVATFLCGISIQHLTESDNVPKIITSMVRYHLYYQIEKFRTNPSLLDRYASQFEKPVRKYLPIKHIKVLSVGKDRDGNLEYYKGTVNYSTTDYKSLIAQSTTGLTKIGQKLFQQSIESYVYAVLGAQAKTRWPIVGEGAKSLQTQDVFHTIVGEMINENDVTTTISNMRTAIKSTNVVLNMAISPGMILVPSNLIIQKEKIPGCNNVLTLATDKMKFGKNADVNYKAPKTESESSTQGGDTTPDTPKTANSESESSTQGGNTGSKSPKTANSEYESSTQEGDTGSKSPKTTSTQGGSTRAVPKPKSPKVSVASEILGVTMMVGGFLISKYLF